MTCKNETLAKTNAADDLRIVPFRADDATHGTPTRIWSVVLDGELYVRDYNGQGSRWYQSAIKQKAGIIVAAGATHDVRFETVDGPVNEKIDDAYRAEYSTSQYLKSLKRPNTRSDYQARAHKTGRDPNMKIAQFGLALTLTLSTATLAFAQQTGQRSLTAMTTNDWSVETVVDNLDYPWEIERSDGRIFITEAAGTVVVVEEGASRRHMLRTSSPIEREGGGGLLGMALAPDFATSGTAYFYHTYLTDQGLTNKVIEAHFDGQNWQESRTLLADIPGHRLYNGGRVAIGPDGNLYVTTGWTENRERPQDLRSLAGKVLRMTPDGQVPADNPFPGSYVYSYGHRNPQGVAWSPSGELFEFEHGQSARDEMNTIKPGANYGWPLIDGDSRRDGMQVATLNSGSDTWGPSGAAFAGSELLVATLVSRGLYVFDPQAGALKPIFSNGERLRDVLPVGDDIYVITTNRSPRGAGPSKDHLLRLSPKR